MPDDFNHDENDQPLNLDAVRDELGRVPIIGPASDRELFLDLPSAGLVAGGMPGGALAPQSTECRPPVEREFLTNDFSHGL